MTHAVELFIGQHVRLSPKALAFSPSARQPRQHSLAQAFTFKTGQRGKDVQLEKNSNASVSTTQMTPTAYASCADRGAIQPIEIHVRMTIQRERASVLKA